MPRPCIYECRHPLWGGSGTCVKSTDPTVDEACRCDVGFASFDSLGYPSCVPKTALVAGYLTLAVTGAVVTMFIAWQAGRHRHLPTLSRTTRRAAIIGRLYASSRSGAVLNGSRLISYEAISHQISASKYLYSCRLLYVCSSAWMFPLSQEISTRPCVSTYFGK